MRIVRMVYNDAGELVPAEIKVQQAQKPPFLKVPKVTDAEKVE